MTQFVKTVSGTISANGNTDPEYIVSTFDRDICSVHLNLRGDFGDGVVTVQMLMDDGSWVDLANGAFTVPVDKFFLARHQGYVRLNTAGATAPDIDWEMRGLGSTGFDS